MVGRYVPKGNVYGVLNDKSLLKEVLSDVNQTIRGCVSESINSLLSVEYALRQRVPNEYQVYKLITRRDNLPNHDLAMEVAFEGLWLKGGRFYLV